jgi:hypothetical protein
MLSVRKLGNQYHAYTKRNIPVETQYGTAAETQYGIYKEIDTAFTLDKRTDTLHTTQVMPPWVHHHLSTLPPDISQSLGRHEAISSSIVASVLEHNPEIRVHDVSLAALGPHPLVSRHLNFDYQRPVDRTAAIGPRPSGGALRSQSVSCFQGGNPSWCG